MSVVGECCQSPSECRYEYNKFINDDIHDTILVNVIHIIV